MASPVSYEKLLRNYPSSDNMSRKELFIELGWNDLVNDSKYKNTCAIRMSYCLIKSGIYTGGRIKIKKGPYKGKLIEPGQGKLSQILAQPHYFGPPLKFKVGEEDKVLANKRGIISFFEIPGYLNGTGGHIDLISQERFFFFFKHFVCGSDCEWTARECWFWPVN